MRYIEKILCLFFFFALFIAPFSAYSKTCCCDFTTKNKMEKMPCHSNGKQVASNQDKKPCSNCACKMGGVSKVFSISAKTDFARIPQIMEHFTLELFSYDSKDYSIFTPPKYSA